MKSVYYNGKVITLEGDDCSAFAVEDETVNLEGKTVLPAFFETHMHILSLGMLLKDINHNDCDSIENLIEISRDYIEKIIFLQANG